MPSQRPVVESPGVRLRIPSEYRLIEADDGRLLLSCGTHFVDVRASFGRKGVAAAIDRLISNPQTLESLTRGLTPVECALVSRVLKKLEEESVLVCDGGASIRPTKVAPGVERLRSMGGLLAVAAGQEATTSPHRLSASRVALIGLGRVGSQLARNLAILGISNFVLVDEGQVDSAVLATDAWYDPTDLGTPLASALAKRLLKYRGGLDIALRSASELASPAFSLSQADIVVVASDYPDPRMWEQVNQHAVTSGVTWTSYRTGWSQGYEIELGPTIFPGETACFECYRLRRLANVVDPESDIAIEKSIASDRDAFRFLQLGISPAVDIFAIEIVRTLLGEPSRLTGAVMTFDLVTMQLRSRPVLKVPQCPSCPRPSRAEAQISAGSHVQSDAAWAPAAGQSLALLYHEQVKRRKHQPFPQVGDEMSLVAPWQQAGRTKSYRLASRVILPHPELPLQVSLASLIRERHTTRLFNATTIQLRDVATILGLSYGASTRPTRRVIPSGGARYPLELYVVALRIEPLAGGLYHYLPDKHLLEDLDDKSPRPPLSACIMDGELASTAAAALCICGVFPRTSEKYGDFGYRLMLLEAGHLAQNALLASEALGLKSFPYCGFYDDLVHDYLRVDGTREFCLYMLWFGQSDPVAVPFGDAAV